MPKMFVRYDVFKRLFGRYGVYVVCQQCAGCAMCSGCTEVVKMCGWSFGGILLKAAYLESG